MKKMIEILKQEVDKAYTINEVPVACVIVKENKIIAKAHNKRKKTNNPLSHCEIECIIKASKKIKTANLGDCTLIVTLEPCQMCKEVIKESRIKKVYYILDSEKKVVDNVSYNKINNILDEDIKYFSEKIKNFFRNKR